MTKESPSPIETYFLFVVLSGFVFISLYLSLNFVLTYNLIEAAPPEPTLDIVLGALMLSFVLSSIVVFIKRI